VWKARPEILEWAAASQSLGRYSIKKVLIGFGMATLLTAGLLSWFASTRPDGLEWSLAKTSGRAALQAPERGIVTSVAGLVGAALTLLLAGLLGVAFRMRRERFATEDYSTPPRDDRV
jgi:hypothetical protein